MNTKANPSMSDLYADFFTKRIPQSVLIFGASGRIGGPMATYITDTEPDIRLRLATSSIRKAEALQQRFPKAEIVSCDYMDRDSLKSAVRDMEGIFCTTPTLLDEKPAMENMVAAVEHAGCLVHMIRQVGLTPEMSHSRLPRELVERGIGLPIQHPIARRVLDEAGLPVTFLNTGASFMDNFLVRMGPALKRERRLIWPERKVPYIDPTEVGEIAARLLMSNDRRHIGLFHTVNNGTDFLQFSEIAQLMSDLWGETITYDGSKNGFFSEYGDKIDSKTLEFLWNFFGYERSVEVAWAPNQCAEIILGRKPRTLSEWLTENRTRILG